MKKKLVLLVALILAFGMFSGFTYTDPTQVLDDSDNAEPTETIANLQNTSTVFSYKDVFRTYYDVATEKAEAFNAVICSFEEFCDNYYISGMDLDQYTQSVVSDCISGQSSGYGIPVSGAQGNAPVTRASSSGDADYMLSKNDHSSTPASDFKRDLYQGLYSFYLVQKGDIVLETLTILNNIGHTAIVSDTSKSSAKGNYVQTIDAVGGGVQFGLLDDKRMVDFGIIILRANATASQRDNIVYFSKQQLGKPYSFSETRTNTSINSTKWYCSELIYASYLYAGINLNCINARGGCMPMDIYVSSKLYIRKTYKTYILNLKIVSKSGSKWTINVTHNRSGNILIDYNTKLCYKGDAREWTGLNHISVNNTVPAGSSGKNFVISTNWAAGTVAFCQYIGGRLITSYANELNSSKKTMHLEHYMIP